MRVYQPAPSDSGDPVLIAVDSDGLVAWLLAGKDAGGTTGTDLVVGQAVSSTGVVATAATAGMHSAMTCADSQHCSAAVVTAWWLAPDASEPATAMTSVTVGGDGLSVQASSVAVTDDGGIVVLGSVAHAVGATTRSIGAIAR